MQEFPIPDVLECMRFVMRVPHRDHRIVRDLNLIFTLAEREILRLTVFRITSAKVV